MLASYSLVSGSGCQPTLLGVEFAVEDGFDHGGAARIGARDEVCMRKISQE